VAAQSGGYSPNSTTFVLLAWAVGCGACTAGSFARVGTRGAGASGGAGLLSFCGLVIFIRVVIFIRGVNLN